MAVFQIVQAPRYEQFLGPKLPPLPPPPFVVRPRQAKEVALFAPSMVTMTVAAVGGLAAAGLARQGLAAAAAAAGAAAYHM